jgi:exodeoxyribonuclease V alpha subunit
VVERIIFLNEENHYTIAEFRPDAPGRSGADTKARPEAVTIIGPLPGVECGETLHLTGEWAHHAQHGAQFKIAGFRSELPASVYGIRKYLGSGLVPGIGKVYANKIVDAFGTDTFRVLSEESGRLRDVEGIGKKRATAIKQAWDAKRTERELYIFLQTYGVTPSQCVKLVKQYGAEARRILTHEPYRVAREIDGIGFKTADRIAINLGFANDAAPRLDAGILYALETLQEEGHTAFPETELRDYTANLLETDSNRVAARIGALVEARALVRHDLGAPTLGARPSPAASDRNADEDVRAPRLHRRAARAWLPSCAPLSVSRVGSRSPPSPASSRPHFPERKLPPRRGRSASPAAISRPRAPCGWPATRAARRRPRASISRSSPRRSPSTTRAAAGS